MCGQDAPCYFNKSRHCVQKFKIIVYVWLTRAEIATVEINLWSSNDYAPCWDIYNISQAPVGEVVKLAETKIKETFKFAENIPLLIFFFLCATINFNKLFSSFRFRGRAPEKNNMKTNFLQNVIECNSNKLLSITFCLRVQFSNKLWIQSGSLM